MHQKLQKLRILQKSIFLTPDFALASFFPVNKTGQQRLLAGNVWGTNDGVLFGQATSCPPPTDACIVITACLGSQKLKILWVNRNLVSNWCLVIFLTSTASTRSQETHLHHHTWKPCRAVNQSGSFHAREKPRYVPRAGFLSQIKVGISRKEEAWFQCSPQDVQGQYHCHSHW